MRNENGTMWNELVVNSEKNGGKRQVGGLGGAIAAYGGGKKAGPMGPFGLMTGTTQAPGRTMQLPAHITLPELRTGPQLEGFLLIIIFL